MWQTQAVSSQPSTTIWHWNRIDFRAMNTDIHAQLYTNIDNSAEILKDVQTMFGSLDRRLSRFNPDSELSRFNQASAPYKASPTLFAVMETALWAAKLTGGLFDPTILPDLECAGYRASFEIITDTIDSPLPEFRHPNLGRFNQISLHRGSYRIDKPDRMTVDLGGIGKGWTVDRVADRLVGLGPFLVNAGGDLYAYGVPPGEAGWSVIVADPLDDENDLLAVRITNNAVATSSITRRQWQRGSRRLHHLIDPRTAQPAETDLLSVTVVGPRVALAEVFAKTALILGSSAGIAYLDVTPSVEALLVGQDGTLYQTSGFEKYVVA